MTQGRGGGQAGAVEPGEHQLMVQVLTGGAGGCGGQGWHETVGQGLQENEMLNPQSPAEAVAEKAHSRASTPSTVRVVRGKDIG